MARRGIFIFIIFLVIGALVILRIPNKSTDNPLSEIEKAIIADNIEKVRLLLKENPTLANQQGRLNRTPLYWAALKGQEQITELLISKGADVNAEDDYGFTPLINAATTGDKKIVEILIANGAKINCKTKPLFRTVTDSEGTVTKTYSIKVKGAYKDWTQDPGNPLRDYPFCGTPLHNAAYEGHIEIVEFLIKAGANLNIKNDREATPLYSAASHDHVKIVEILLNNGANINEKNFSGYTPLASVAERDHTDVARFLISKGADVNTPNDYGNTPLFQAVGWYGNIEITKMLVENGANINIKNESNCTPLHYACLAGDPNIVDFLLTNGAQINIKDTSGRTFLHDTLLYSTKPSEDSERKRIVEMLISKGSKVNEQDNNGNTALHLAAENGYIETIKSLLANGADVDIENKLKKTPLHIADEKAQMKNRRLAPVFREIFFLLLKHSKMPESQTKKFKCVKQTK